MEIKLKLEKEDLIRFGYEDFLSNIFNIIWPLLALAGAVYEFFINAGMNFLFMIIYGITLFSYAYIYTKHIPKSALERYSASAYARGLSLKIDNTGLFLENMNGSLINWTNLYAVRKMPGFILFYITKTNFIIVPAIYYKEKSTLYNEIKGYAGVRTYASRERFKLATLILNIILALLLFILYNIFGVYFQEFSSMFMPD